ncbi:hypothetical protein GCM10027068_18690 [Prescottella soli]
MASDKVHAFIGSTGSLVPGARDPRPAAAAVAPPEARRIAATPMVARSFDDLIKSCSFEIDKA